MNSSTPESSTNSTTMEDNMWLLSSVNMWAYGINFLLGFPTHSYIIWLVVRGTGNGVALEFFNINLSICELGFSFNCLLGLLSKFIQVLPHLPEFLIGVTITGRPLFQCLMCVERYLAVVHPVTFLKYRSLRYRAICCVVAWMITLSSCLFCMFSLDASDLVEFMWLFPVQFIVFLLVQLFCLVAVLRALKQSGPGERKREKEENHMKRRAFYLILIITVCMFIMFIPYILTSLFIIFTQKIMEMFNTLSFVCFILGGFVHPVLFLHRTGKLWFVIKQK